MSTAARWKMPTPLPRNVTPNWASIDRNRALQNPGPHPVSMHAGKRTTAAASKAPATCPEAGTDGDRELSGPRADGRRT